MCRLRVRQPGAYSTIQDAGRYGYQQYGVPICGALDRLAFRIANLLVGNPPDAAALEMTVLGPTLEVVEPGWIAIAGADLRPTLNRVPIAVWSSVYSKAGDVVAFRGLGGGCRAYLAVEGGIRVPSVLGSRSTYVGGAMGGIEGRPLRAGDVIASCPAMRAGGTRTLPESWIPKYTGDYTLRVIRGPQADLFAPRAFEKLFGSPFRVTDRADRQGVQIEGPELSVRAGSPPSIISEANIPGGIQITPDGRGFILMREQTTGGYPKIATVISVDLPWVAQAKPGDTFRFLEVSVEQAHRVLRDHEAWWSRVEAWARG